MYLVLTTRNRYRFICNLDPSITSFFVHHVDFKATGIPYPEIICHVSAEAVRLNLVALQEAQPVYISTQFKVCCCDLIMP